MKTRKGLISYFIYVFIWLTFTLKQSRKKDTSVKFKKACHFSYPPFVGVSMVTIM